jgi:hypothetical protein
MGVSLTLNDVLTYGFRFAETCWPALSIACALGLAFMLAGHRLGVSRQALINRTIIYLMAAILLFAGAFIGLAIYATSIDRSYGFGLLIFVGWLLVPIVLSVIGVLLPRFSGLR